MALTQQESSRAHRVSNLVGVKLQPDQHPKTPVIHKVGDDSWNALAEVNFPFLS